MVKRKIILEMANNHMGSYDHGILMIDKFSDTVSSFRDHFDFVWKFQFRDIDTFIHPAYKNRTDLKYVNRFTETSLTNDQFKRLKDHAALKGFKTLCTAFDENSITSLEDMGFDMIKIASCSCTDWPLLNRAVKNDLPIIVSVAGASLQEVDNIVSFLKHRDKDFSIMHCVGEYPTHRNNLQLNQIDLFKSRYDDILVGYSTHEEPSETAAVKIALGKGAALLEKHVAVETEEYPKNAYSVDTQELYNWLSSAKDTIDMMGVTDKRHNISENEIRDLTQFKRGAFLAKNVSRGDTITREDVYYAWPSVDGQILANDMSKYVKYTVNEDIDHHQPLMGECTTYNNSRDKVWEAVQAVKRFIRNSGVVFPGEADLELSHHYGIDTFFNTGITMVTVVNRSYCKKLIVVLPCQVHPGQYHKKKEETFVILHGEVSLTLDDTTKVMKEGDVHTIEPGTVHSFTSTTGCIIEEVSSTHYKDDSYYIDESIHENKHRKTLVTHWL